MKRVISFIAAAVLLTAAVIGTSAADNIKGDVNGDGEINNKDVVILFRYVSQNGTYDEIYDYNGDGSVDNKDVVALFRASSEAGIPDTDTDTEPVTDTDTEPVTDTDTEPVTDDPCANGHTLITETVKEPTETENGLKRDRCTVCGWTGNEQVIPKLQGACEHHWVRYIVKEGDNQANTPFNIHHAGVPIGLEELAGYYGVDWVVYYCDKCGKVEPTFEYGFSQDEANEMFLGYLNDLRVGLGLRKVKTSDYLKAIAQRRAVEIITNFSHDGHVTRYENIAYGCGNVYEAFVMWCNSPGHYATLIRPNAEYGAFAYSPMLTCRALYAVWVAE